MVSSMKLNPQDHRDLESGLTILHVSPHVTRLSPKKIHKVGPDWGLNQACAPAGPMLCIKPPSIWRAFWHFAKSTSNHPTVKLRCLIINPTFNQQKLQFPRFAEANCLFTYLHKILVEIHLQETRNNRIVGLLLSLHHLFDHRLTCRVFPVRKEITRTRPNLKCVSECRKFSYSYGLCFPDTWAAIYST